MLVWREARGKRIGDDERDALAARCVAAVVRTREVVVEQTGDAVVIAWPSPHDPKSVEVVDAIVRRTGEDDQRRGL